MISMFVREGIVGEHDCRGNFPKASMDEVFEAGDREAIQKALATVRSEENVIDPIRYTVVGLDNRKIPVDVYVQRGRSSPLVRVRFKSKKGQPDCFDSRPYMRSHFSVGDRILLEKEDGHVLRIVGREPAT